MRPIFRSFASDNNAGASPEIIQAISDANRDHVVAYGDDPYTERAVAKFRQLLGDDVEVFFVFNGTAANVLGLQALTRTYQAVLCAKSAHINTDECGAPEKFLGLKLIDLDAPGGKLTPEILETAIHGRGDEHHVQPKVVSVTQSTEVGSLYLPEELAAISRFCRANDLYFHMDGARIANAAAALGVPIRAFTRDVGVDVLSFGGTKNGILFGEAVVFFNRERAADFKYIRKQGMQLTSKMRYLSAQFERLLTDDLWLRNARHANAMAKVLETKVRAIRGLEVARPVEVNAVFVKLPVAALRAAREESFFYAWDEAAGEARWMCAFDTTERDIDEFLAVVKKSLA